MSEVITRKCQCVKCERKILVEIHTEYEEITLKKVTVTCSDCLQLNQIYIRDNPEQAKSILEWQHPGRKIELE